MVFVLLGPADEYCSVAVQPGVTGLDDPPASSPLRVALFEVDLLAASTDVGHEFAVFEEFPDNGEVIGLIQTETLGIGLGRAGALDRD